MFEFNTWVVNNLVAGVKNKNFSKEWAAIQLANYYIKNKITENDIERFEMEVVNPTDIETSDAVDEVESI